MRLFRATPKPPELEERLTTVERQLRALQVEWMDTLDRLKTMMGRIVKDRARAEAARGEDALPPNEISEETPTTLSPRAQQINAQILARRNRMHQ